jgi:hypothetical protein
MVDLSAKRKVNPRTIRVETLVGVIEDMDPKLKALGIVEANGEMIYVSETTGPEIV